jgi:hypothetical protein
MALVADMEMRQAMIIIEHSHSYAEEISNCRHRKGPPSRYHPKAMGFRPPRQASTILHSYRGEHGFAAEQSSPITAMPWISISMPGRAKFDTVISALAG